jgi:hypothetical protein
MTTMNCRSVLWFGMLSLFGCALQAATRPFPDPAILPATPAWPEPLRQFDGRPIATEDQWANPAGQFAMLQAAAPVYRFLKAGGPVVLPEQTPDEKRTHGQVRAASGTRILLKPFLIPAS